MSGGMCLAWWQLLTAAANWHGVGDKMLKIYILSFKMCTRKKNTRSSLSNTEFFPLAISLSLKVVNLDQHEVQLHHTHTLAMFLFQLWLVVWLSSHFVSRGKLLNWKTFEKLLPSTGAEREREMERQVQARLTRLASRSGLNWVTDDHAAY